MPSADLGLHPMYNDFEERRKQALAETGMIPMPGAYPGYEPPPDTNEDPSAPGMDPSELEAYEPAPSEPPVQDAPAPAAVPPSPGASSLQDASKMSLDDLVKFAGPPAPTPDNGWDRVRSMMYSAGTRTPIAPGTFQDPAQPKDDLKRQVALELIKKRIAGDAKAARPGNPLYDGTSEISKSLVAQANANGQRYPEGTPGYSVVFGAGELHKGNRDTTNTNTVALRKGEALARLEKAKQEQNTATSHLLNKYSEDTDKKDTVGQISAFQTLEDVAGPGTTDITAGQAIDPATMSKLPPEQQKALQAFYDWQSGKGLVSDGANIMKNLPIVGGLAEAVTRNGVNSMTPPKVQAMQAAWNSIKAGIAHGLYGSNFTGQEMRRSDDLFQEGLRSNPLMAMSIISRFKRNLGNHLFMSGQALESNAPQAMVDIQDATGNTWHNPLFAKQFPAGSRSVSGNQVDWSGAGDQIRSVGGQAPGPVVQEPPSMPAVEAVTPMSAPAPALKARAPQLNPGGSQESMVTVTNKITGKAKSMRKSEAQKYVGVPAYEVK